VTLYIPIEVVLGTIDRSIEQYLRRSDSIYGANKCKQIITIRTAGWHVPIGIPDSLNT